MKHLLIFIYINFIKIYGIFNIHKKNDNLNI